MDSKLSLDKTATVKADFAKLMADVAAIEPVLSIFPKLESLKKIGDKAYEWKLKPVGAMGVSHAVHYAATYELDAANGKLNFKAKDRAKAGTSTTIANVEFRFV